MMRWAVVGAGAVGSLYAGMLARAGEDVWLVGRSPAHVAAVAAHGLRMSAPNLEDDWVVPVKATTRPADAGPVDVVIFLTKSYDLAAAAAGARALFDVDTVALPLLNGLGAPAAIRVALGQVALACGVCEVGGDIIAPGHLRMTENVVRGTGYTRFGADAGTAPAPRLAAIAAALEASGLRAEVLDDIAGFIWTKLAMAGTMSSIAAITRLRVGRIAGSDEGRRLLTRTIGEIAAVAHAQGIGFDRERVLARAWDVFATVPDHIPSMAADLREGRRTENAALAGAVAREGARLGVPTPICDLLSDAIALIERHPGESIW